MMLHHIAVLLIAISNFMAMRRIAKLEDRLDTLAQITAQLIVKFGVNDLDNVEIRTEYREKQK